MPLIISNSHLGPSLVLSAMKLQDSFRAILCVPRWVSDRIRKEGFPIEAHQLYSRYFAEGVDAIIIAHRLFHTEGNKDQLMVYICRQDYVDAYVEENDLPPMIPAWTVLQEGPKRSW